METYIQLFYSLKKRIKRLRTAKNCFFFKKREIFRYFYARFLPNSTFPIYVYGFDFILKISYYHYIVTISFFSKKNFSFLIETRGKNFTYITAFSSAQKINTKLNLPSIEIRQPQKLR